MLPVPSQLALTPRAVGGLTTSEIARAFLVPEATMAKRISRAKQQLRSAGVQFDMPPEAEWAGRLQVVLHMLYLLFSEATPPPQARTSIGRTSPRRPSGWRDCCTNSSPGTARSQGCWH